jgi:tetratricopeptide (TPR) repeat protein
MRLIACLIARDEEANLPRCLGSLSAAVDGICLLDTGSSDRTAEIALSFGAVVGSLPWSDDFSASRNACLDLADGDWVLQVDADEELDPATIPTLRQSLSEPGMCRLVEVSLLDGTDHPGSVLLPRLFRLDPRIRYRRALHESVLDSLAEAGLGEPSGCAVRLIHHGYSPDARAGRAKHERNAGILRKVRDRGEADPYDLYKLGTTLSRWTDGPERSASLGEAWSLSLRASSGERRQWPWWPSLAHALALDLASTGKLQEAWEILESTDDVGDRSILQSGRAQLLLRSGRPREALEVAQRALAMPPESALAVASGKERGELAHLAARSARRLGMPFLPYLEDATALGQIDARCDLILLRIQQGLPAGWKDLDVLLRTQSGHPVVLIAASEAARSQGDRSTSDLLLDQASRIPSEAALRARARLWVRAWLGGASPAFDLPPSDVENAAAQGLDRILAGRPWFPDPFLHGPTLRGTLGDILRALLEAGRVETVRRFAREAVGREAELPGISTLVEDG